MTTAANILLDDGSGLRNWWSQGADGYPEEVLPLIALDVAERRLTELGRPNKRAFVDYTYVVNGPDRMIEVYAYPGDDLAMPRIPFDPIDTLSDRVKEATS